MSLRVWRYWKLPQGGQLNKSTQLSRKLPIPTLDSEVLPPCTAPAQVCTYVHKYARSGMFTAPRSLKAPHVKLSASPFTAKRTKGGVFTVTVGCHTRRGRENHNCMEQGRWMSQRRMSDTRSPAACQIYTPPHSVFNTRPWVALSIPFYYREGWGSESWVPCLHPLVADSVLLLIFQWDWVTNRILLCKLEFPPNWTPESVR